MPGSIIDDEMNAPIERKLQRKLLIGGAAIVSSVLVIPSALAGHSNPITGYPITGYEIHVSPGHVIEGSKTPTGRAIAE